MSDDEAFDPDEFLFSGVPYWVAPKNRPTKPKQFALSLMMIDTTEGTFPMIFTDRDAAVECIERKGMESYEPFAIPHHEIFIQLLNILRGCGFSSIAIDPYGPGLRTIPITRLIHDIRNRPYK